MTTQAEQRRVRQVIELLTAVLKQNGFLEVRAETFRLAKFDKPSAVESLWNLLFETIYLIHNGKVDGNCYELLLELAPKKSEFLALPDDMSAGSRQLLLAFGWLFCKQEVICRMMFASTKDLFVDQDDDARFLFRSSTDESEMSSSSKELDFDRLGLCDKVNRLVWLNGKLQYRLRKLLTLERQMGKLKQRVAVATYSDRGAGATSSGQRTREGEGLLEATQKQLLDYLAVEFDRRHLSLLELELLKRPGELERHVAALESDRERLENLMRWRAEEDVFWDWLVSVLELDAAATAARRHDENGNESDSSITTVSSQSQLSSRESGTQRPGATWHLHGSLVRELAAAHARLERACAQYESVAARIDSEWQRHVTALRCGLEPDDASFRRALDATVRQIDSQIDAELRVLSRFGWLLAPGDPESNTDSKSDASQSNELERTVRSELECSTRYYMVDDSGARRRAPPRTAPVGPSPNSSLNSRSFATVSSVQNEIARLEADLAGLDDALQSRYRTFSGELRSFAGRLALPQEAAAELELSDTCDSPKCSLVFPSLRKPTAELA